MDLLLCLALYCNEHWGEEGKQGREVASLSFTNPTFTILNQPAHTTPCHEHDALTMWWYSIGQHFCSWSQAKIYIFSFSTQCPGVMLAIQTASHNGFDQTADAWWTCRPVLEPGAWLCQFSILLSSCEYLESSNSERNIWGAKDHSH